MGAAAGKHQQCFPAHIKDNLTELIRLTGATVGLPNSADPIESLQTILTVGQADSATLDFFIRSPFPSIGNMTSTLTCLFTNFEDLLSPKKNTARQKTDCALLFLVAGIESGFVQQIDGGKLLTFQH